MKRIFSVSAMLAAITGLLLAAGCGNGQSTSSPSPIATPTVTASATPTQAIEEVPTYTYSDVKSYPHDTKAFTQGLVVDNGKFLESTGLNGQSSLRRVAIETGDVLQSVKVPQQYFAEGMTLFKGKIYQLTWKAQKGFIYDPTSFSKTGEFAYEGEGWGLTHDDTSLILSDGTNKIRFLDPDTFKVIRTIEVFNQGQPETQLNELEYVNGEIYANVWQTDFIVRIDPATGKLLGIIDCTGLLPASEKTATTDVLNGIAYDKTNDKLYITGKNWPKVFLVTLKKL